MNNNDLLAKIKQNIKIIAYNTMMFVITTIILASAGFLFVIFMLGISGLIFLLGGGQ